MTEDSQASSAARPPRAFSHDDRPAAVVLAGGKGTRMRSQRHKVLHPVAGKPMVWHVLVALERAGIAPQDTVVVVGDGAPAVREAIEADFGRDRYRFAYQEVPLGTGHATLAARDEVPGGAGDIVVAYGDTPLLQAATIRRLLDEHHRAGGPLTLITGRIADPTGYGRIVRTDGQVQAIVEERDAPPAIRQIREINSGFCVVAAGWLWARLPDVAPAPNGEIYLTALPATAVAEGATVATVVLDEVVEALGVNTRAQLAEAETILRRRIVQRLLDGGVTIQDPATTYVDAGVEVAPDSLILANTHLTGATAVGGECVLGPNSIIRDSTIGDRCRVTASMLDGAILETDVTVGPFAHVRPGTRCGRGAAVGTGSEINRSTLGPGSKMMHFGYLGDTTVGEQVNVGAGTITCNFDGTHKHATTIGDGAFVGSGTLLVAPVTVGEGALTGAGSVVLRDVAPETKVAGVPARQIGRRNEAPAVHPADDEPPAGAQG